MYLWVQFCFRVFLRKLTPFIEKGKLSLKTPSPALPLTFMGKELSTGSGLGFLSLEPPYRSEMWIYKYEH